MKNKLKAALITLSIIGTLTLVVIVGTYFPLTFVAGLVIMGAGALFYTMYDTILHGLNVKDENKIGGKNDN